ncbi:MAG: glutaredoxin [Bdellovibrionales bacterium]
MADILLYKKNPCPFCDRAINLLEGRGLKYDVVDLTDRMDELQKIKQQYGWQTVPIIVIKGKLIGGYTDLKALDESGELDKLLG